MTKCAGAATMESENMLHGRSAHEYHRTRQGIPRVTPRVGGTDGVGLAAVSALWPDVDAQVGVVHPSPVDLGRAAGSAGAAAPVRTVLSGAGAPRDLQRGVAVAGAGELVCAGGAPRRA